jgi:hypothetical protein
VTVAAELEEAAQAARRHARAGERVAAVMVAEPAAAERVYLIALEQQTDLAYLALDAALEPVGDPRLVRDAVVMLALAERAEEASSALHADELAAQFAEAAGALAADGLDQPAAAAADVRLALGELSAAADGPRVATAAYLDAIATASGRLAVALVGLRDLLEVTPAGPAPPPSLEQAWRAIAAAAGAGDPSQFSQAMTATTGAMEALADDVLDRLRAV